MKILHISMYSWAAGGLSRVVFDHANYQAKAGNEVSIVSVVNPNDKIYDVPPNVTLIVYRASWFSKFLPFFSMEFYHFLKNKAANFDLIHIHGIFHFGSIAPFFFAKNKPTVISIHGMLEKWAYAKGRLKKEIFSVIIQRRILKKATLVHVEQAEEWQDTKKYLNKTDANFLLLPNGIDLKSFENLPPKGSFRSRLRILPDKKILFFISRLNLKKGLDILLPAFYRFSQENSDTYLVIAGPDDGYQANIQKFIEENQLRDKILLTGMITGNEKLEAFADADIFVLPSYSEGFSIAVLEAMAAQIPALVSEKTGFSDEIRRWKAGEIVSLNSDSIYEGIKHLIKDANYRNSLKINALSMLKTQYNLDIITEKLLQAYKKITHFL